MSRSNSIPQLEAPGAGLPAPVLFVARRLFAFKCRFGKREAFSAEFEAERQAIRDLVQSCGADQLSRRVLVPRLRGLEDSSRFYSVWMTLDHLRITNLGFAKIIEELVDGRTPDFVVSTADVKPDPNVRSEVADAYEQSCEHLLETLRRTGDLHTAVKHPHPWFGPLNAYRWLALAAMHMGIHRKQIATILKRLPG